MAYYNFDGFVKSYVTRSAFHESISKSGQNHS